MKVKIILLVAVLLCAMCASGSARWTDISDIEKTDTIFVWETGLDLTGVNASVTIDSLRKYVDDDRTKGLLNIVPVANPRDFDVSNAEVCDQLGIYYIYNATYGALPEYVIIKKPTPSLDVVLNSSHSDSINGESIDIDTKIAFKVMSPLVGAYYKYGSSYPAQAKIEFTTPSGGKTCILNNTDFSRINITKTTLYTDTDTFWGPTNLVGVHFGTYSAVMKWVMPEGFKDYARSSAAVTFTVETQSLSVTSEKTSVVPGNNFVTTVSGKSDTRYVIYIQNALLNGTTHLYPEILHYQPGVDISTSSVDIIAATGFTDLPQWGGAIYRPSIAYVTTKADGTRPVEWVTNSSTDDRTFTVKVTENSIENPKSDVVTVKVEEGSVTITDYADRSYYLGEVVILSGTNSDSNIVYLYMTGPNLRPDGVSLVDPTNDDFSPVYTNVYSDDSWSYRWDTAGLPIDTGTYTIYATAKYAEKSNLGGIKYDSVPVVIKAPFIEAVARPSSLAVGDEITIEINSEGEPTDVGIWMVADEYFATYELIAPASDRISKTYTINETMPTGTYYFIAQHPMYNGRLDVVPADNGDVLQTTVTKNTPEIVKVLSLVGTEKITQCYLRNGSSTVSAITGYDAAQTIIDSMNSPDIDDTYYKLSFIVEEPWIQIQPISDRYVGEQFIITGTTNIKTGESYSNSEKLLVEVGNLSSGVIFSGNPGLVNEDTQYCWSYYFDTRSLYPGQYTVAIQSTERPSETASTTFNLVEGSSDPQSCQNSPNFVITSMQASPSIDSLSTGDSVTLSCFLSLRASEGLLFPETDSLEVYTNLDNPNLYYFIMFNSGDSFPNIATINQINSFTLDGWELSYPSSNTIDIRYQISGTIPSSFETGNDTIFGLRQIDADGNVVPCGEVIISATPGDTSISPTPSISDTITLSPGWNFISTPRPLAAGSNTFAIFSEVDTSGRQILGYDANAETWVAKQSTDTFDSMAGIWIYANESAIIYLNYATGAAATPPVKTVYPGWNAVGLSDSSATSASNALTTIEGVWKILIDFNGASQSYETSIIKGATGSHAETRDMTPKRGYWLYATGTGTLAAISA